MIKKFQGIDSTWFFSPTPLWAKILSIYVKGDALIVLPFWTLTIFLAIWQSYFGLLIAICFLFIRSLGELIYWLLQQFGERSYRSEDFGLRNLDNHAIYIFYQLFSTVWASIYLSLLIVVGKLY